MMIEFSADAETRVQRRVSDRAVSDDSAATFGVDCRRRRSGTQGHVAGGKIRSIGPQPHRPVAVLDLRDHQTDVRGRHQ